MRHKCGSFSYKKTSYYTGINISLEPLVAWAAWAQVGILPYYDGNTGYVTVTVGA